MILTSFGLYQAVDTWVFKTKELRPLLLSASEWQTLRQLGEILEVWSMRSHLSLELSDGHLSGLHTSHQGDVARWTADIAVRVARV